MSVGMREYLKERCHGGDAVVEFTLFYLYVEFYNGGLELEGTVYFVL